MSREDTFKGAKNAFAFYTAYVSEVAGEIGMDRAVALSGQVDEALGAAQGQMLKQQVGRNEIDIATAASLARETIEQGFGIASNVVEEGETAVVLQCHRCPVYEASIDLGIDAETVEAHCRSGAIKFMDAMVKQLDPSLRYELRQFRTGADGYCEEALVRG